MNRRKTRVFVSILQILVFVFLAGIVLGFQLFSFPDLQPLLVLLAIAIVLLLFIRRKDIVKEKKK